MSKTLLITDIPPCKNYTAGLVLDQLVRFLPKGSVSCFAVVNKDISDARLTPDLDWLKIHYVDKPLESSGTRVPGAFGEVYSFIYECYVAQCEIGKIIDHAVDFGREFGVEKIWCVLQGQTMVRIARPTAERLGVPIYVQIWDPFEWWLRAHKVNRLTSSRLLEEFDNVMMSAKASFAASWVMADEFRNKYGIRAVDFMPSLPAEFAFSPECDLNSESELVIAMAGQLYAREEWDALLRALRQMSWRVGSRAIRIVLLGSHSGLVIPEWASAHITKTGWLSQYEVVKTCNSADILYCPYWFNKEYEREARLSFPSKLTSYFASGRPVMFHGPEYASPSLFLSKYDAGYACHSLEEDKIVDCIQLIASDKNKYAEVSKNACLQFKEFMTEKTMKERLFEFLEYGPS